MLHKDASPVLILQQLSEGDTVTDSYRRDCPEVSVNSSWLSARCYPVPMMD